LEMADREEKESKLMMKNWEYENGKEEDTFKYWKRTRNTEVRMDAELRWRW